MGESSFGVGPPSGTPTSPTLLSRTSETTPGWDSRLSWGFTFGGGRHNVKRKGYTGVQGPTPDPVEGKENEIKVRVEAHRRAAPETYGKSPDSSRLPRSSGPMGVHCRAP